MLAEEKEGLLNGEGADDGSNEVQKQCSFQFWNVLVDSMSFIYGFAMYDTLVDAAYALIFNQRDYKTMFLFAVALTVFFEPVVRNFQHHRQKTTERKAWAALLKAKLPFIVGIAWSSFVQAGLVQLIETEVGPGWVQNAPALLYFLLFCLMWILMSSWYHGALAYVATLLDDEEDEIETPTAVPSQPSPDIQLTPFSAPLSPQYALGLGPVQVYQRPPNFVAFQSPALASPMASQGHSQPF